MKENKKYLQAIKQNLKGIRDNEIRSKARFLILILEDESIQRGCDRRGIVRQTFYNWLARLKESNFDIYSLKNKSSRPKNSHGKTSPENEKRVLKLHTEHGNSDRLLAIQFEQRYGKKIAHSTVCKILKLWRSF